MKKFKKSRCLMILPLTILLFHQVTGQKISGKIVNEDHQPLPFVNVILKSAPDSIFVRGAITDQNGEFELQTDVGKFFLAISMVGYQDRLIELHDILNQQQSLDLEIISLKEKIQALDEVVVRENKPVFEKNMQGLVINVQHNIYTNGSTALDILERSPGVVLNRQDNTISLMGKHGVSINFNGKGNRMPLESAMAQLAGLNAEYIEKIEILTNPTSEYDAEGNAGIINIVLKEKQEKQLQLDINGTLGFGYGEKAAANVHVSHQVNKLGYYGGYNFNRDRSHQVIENFKMENGLINTTTESERKPITTTQQARFGINYSLNPITTFGASFNGFFRKWDMKAFNTTRFLGSVNKYRQNIRNKEINDSDQLIANIYWQQIIGNNQQLELDLDYLHLNNRNPSQYLFPNSGLVENLMAERAVFKNTPIRIRTGKLDYSNDVSQKVRLKAGIKGSYSNFSNTVKVQQNFKNGKDDLENFSENNDLNEKVLAGFASANINLDVKWVIQGGLRYEYTQSKVCSEETVLVNRTYGNLFPHISLALQETDWSGQFSFLRRINRPTFNDLAPFFLFLDTATYFSGNPNLRPALSNAFKADLNYRGYQLSITFNRETNGFAPFQPDIDHVNNRQFISTRNIDRQHFFSLLISLPVNLTNWWEIQNHLSGQYHHLKTSFSENQIEFSQWNLQYNSTHLFHLPGNFTIEISGNYQSPFRQGITRMKAFGSLNIGIQKELANQGGKLSLSMSDLLQTTTWRMENKIPGTHIQVNSNFKVEPRVIRFSYSRSIGSLKKRELRHTGSEEEQRRLK